MYYSSKKQVSRYTLARHQFVYADGLRWWETIPFIVLIILALIYFGALAALFQWRKQFDHNVNNEVINSNNSTNGILNQIPVAENNKSSQQSHINKELWKLTSGDFVAQHLRDKVAATPNTVYHQPAYGKKIYRDAKHHKLSSTEAGVFQKNNIQGLWIGHHTKHYGFQQKSNKAYTVTAIAMVTEMQILEENITHGDIKMQVIEKHITHENIKIPVLEENITHGDIKIPALEEHITQGDIKIPVLVENITHGDIKIPALEEHITQADIKIPILEEHITQGDIQIPETHVRYGDTKKQNLEENVTKMHYMSILGGAGMQNKNPRTSTVMPTLEIKHQYSSLSTQNAQEKWKKFMKIINLCIRIQSNVNATSTDKMQPPKEGNNSLAEEKRYQICSLVLKVILPYTQNNTNVITDAQEEVSSPSFVQLKGTREMQVKRKRKKSSFYRNNFMKVFQNRFESENNQYLDPPATGYKLLYKNRNCKSHNVYMPRIANFQVCYNRCHNKQDCVFIIYNDELSSCYTKTSGCDDERYLFYDLGYNFYHVY